MSFNNSSVEYLNLSLENPAWEEAEDPDISDAFYIFAIVWLSINLVLGFCVNGLIICVFIREKSVSIVNKTYFHFLGQIEVYYWMCTNKFFRLEKDPKIRLLTFLPASLFKGPYHCANLVIFATRSEDFQKSLFEP